MAKAAKLSSEMVDNIKNYGDEIKTLKDFVTSVRKRPGMYIGGIGDYGFKNMFREIIQNGFDELNKDKSPCDTVWITFDERSFVTVVEDNGRGIPFGRIIKIFENEHTSSNFDKVKGEYSSGLHGVGAKVTNALSKFFIVDSYILGEGRHVEFKDGYPWKKGEQVIPKKEASGKQGTRITFQPQLEVLGDLSVTWEDMFELVKLIAPLNKIGSTIHFVGVDSKGKSHKHDIDNEDGILTYLINDTTKPLVKPIHLFKDTGEMKIEILFTYDVSEDGNSAMHAFSNFCPTLSGTHIEGFYEGIGQFFSGYMNKIYLAKSDASSKKKKTKAKLSVTAADTRSGLCAVISAACLEPMFSGQAKERLTNAEMKPFVKNAVIELLGEWSKNNASDFNKLCKYFKEVAELRTQSDKERIKLNKKYNASPMTGLPANFIAPTGNKDLELWIVEGQSAGGTMQNCRINTRQGYFPIRGKIINAFTHSREKVLSNEEVAGIIAIIFHKYPDFDINKLGKKNFKIDVSKIKWSKIIFGTDADPDGKHIDNLLLNLFVLYMPELLEAGMVYAAKPPLYGINNKGKMTYLTDRMEYVKHIQKVFSKKYSISDINGKPLTSAQLSKFLYVNIDYVYEINKVSNRYSIDPVLLESIITLRNLKPKEMEKKLKKLFRFINMAKKNGTYVIEGIVNDKFQTVFLDDRLIKDCADVIDILDKNRDYAYKLNGEVRSIYEIMYLFDTESPSNIERYKGLGEMDAHQLFDSTMDPENRMLIRYTLEDVQKTIDEIRYCNNNFYELIKSVKVTRFDMLD